YSLPISFSLLTFIPYFVYSIFISDQYISLFQRYSEKISTKLFPFLKIPAQQTDSSASQILHIPGSLFYNIFPYNLYVFSEYNMLFFIFSILFFLLYYFFNIF